MKTFHLVAMGLVLTLLHPLPALAQSDAASKAKGKVDALNQSVKQTASQVLASEKDVDEAIQELQDEATLLDKQLKGLTGQKSLVSEKPFKSYKQTRIDAASGQLQVRTVQIIEQTWSETQVSTTLVQSEFQYATRKRPTLAELKTQLEGTVSAEGKVTTKKVVDVTFDDAAGVATVELSVTSK